jgi:uncharacterized membrane protein
MSLLPFCQWLQETDVSVAIREGALLYPIIGGIHLLAIALFGGMVLAADVRMLGWGLRRESVTDLIGSLRVWKWVGCVVVVVTGVLLAWCEPIKLYHSKSFWIKMTLFALVGVHALIFRRSVYQSTARLDQAPTMPARARLAAALSLILWAGIVFSGRLIAFDS